MSLWPYLLSLVPNESQAEEAYQQAMIVRYRLLLERWETSSPFTLHSSCAYPYKRGTSRLPGTCWTRSPVAVGGANRPKVKLASQQYRCRKPNSCCGFLLACVGVPGHGQHLQCEGLSGVRD
jgi:hypothetical protein